MLEMRQQWVCEHSIERRDVQGTHLTSTPMQYNRVVRSGLRNVSLKLKRSSGSVSRAASTSYGYMGDLEFLIIEPRNVRTFQKCLTPIGDAKQTWTV